MSQTAPPAPTIRTSIATKLCQAMRKSGRLPRTHIARRGVLAKLKERTQSGSKCAQKLPRKHPDTQQNENDVDFCIVEIRWLPCFGAGLSPHF